MKKKICFISDQDPSDKKVLSGTPYSIYSKLSENYDVEWIGKVNISLFEKFIISTNRVFNKIFLGKRLKNGMNTLHAKIISKHTDRLLEDRKFDFLFAYMASSAVSYIKNKTTIITLGDATFDLLCNFYFSSHKLSQKGLDQANNIDQRSLNNSKHIIFSSNWAAQSAINFYHQPEDKISVLNFGANIEDEISPNYNIPLDKKTKCKLLFLGVDWERKGGKKALEILRELNKKEFNCSLTIIGCIPKEEVPENVTVIPSLDKNKPEEAKLINEHLQNTHFLILPTIADCTPMVFSEAMAFSLPVISNNIGGISNIIQDGKNGKLFSIKSIPSEYTSYIIKTWNNKEEYLKLRENAYNRYHQDLNWQHWISEFNKIINKI